VAIELALSAALRPEVRDRGELHALSTFDAGD
jgi:hypothetical protein